MTLWGTGTPRREFLYSDDMAAACVHLMELPPDKLATLVNDREPPLVNVGCGEDLDDPRARRDRPRHRRRATSTIEWDATKPDGTPRKLLDVSRLSALGWRYSIGLPDGIRRAYADFLARS